MGKLARVTMCGILALVTVAVAVELTEDPPVATAGKAGCVRGTITPANKVAGVTLVSRVTGKQIGRADVNGQSGAFEFRDVPGDARYDVRIQTTVGRTYEGIDLDFVDARLLRLAEVRRKQLRVPGKTVAAFAEGDVKWLKDFVTAQKTFTHIHRPLYIRGKGARAVVLLELIRTKPFVASEGKMVWRVELWYFRKAYGGWEKVPNTERVLRRERLVPADWRKIHVEYLPELSVYVDGGGASEAIHFTLPDKPDSSRGRCPNTAPEMKTAAHVLGVPSAR